MPGVCSGAQRLLQEAHGRVLRGAIGSAGPAVHLAGLVRGASGEVPEGAAQTLPVPGLRGPLQTVRTMFIRKSILKIRVRTFLAHFAGVCKMT